MDTERNQGDSNKPSDSLSKLDKTNTHWQPFEIGYLLGMTLDDRPMGLIGDGLGRTGDACRKMLLRLMGGKAECPPQYADSLEKIRQANQPTPKRTSHADDLIVEQYRALSRKIDDLRETVEQLRSSLVFATCESSDGQSLPAMEPPPPTPNRDDVSSSSEVAK